MDKLNYDNKQTYAIKNLIRRSMRLVKTLANVDDEMGFIVLSQNEISIQKQSLYAIRV